MESHSSTPQRSPGHPGHPSLSCVVTSSVRSTNSVGGLKHHVITGSDHLFFIRTYHSFSLNYVGETTQVITLLFDGMLATASSQPIAAWLVPDSFFNIKVSQIQSTGAVTTAQDPFNVTTFQLKFWHSNRLKVGKLLLAAIDILIRIK